MFAVSDMVTVANPPQQYPGPLPADDHSISPLATGLVGLATGAVAVAAVNKAKNLKRSKDNADEK